MTEKQKENIKEATEMMNLYNKCLKKIDFLTEIKCMYGDLKISQIIGCLEYQSDKFNKKFKSLIKES